MTANSTPESHDAVLAEIPELAAAIARAGINGFGNQVTAIADRLAAAHSAEIAALQSQPSAALGGGAVGGDDFTERLTELIRSEMPSESIIHRCVELALADAALATAAPGEAQREVMPQDRCLHGVWAADHCYRCAEVVYVARPTTDIPAHDEACNEACGAGCPNKPELVPVAQLRELLAKATPGVAETVDYDCVLVGVVDEIHCFDRPDLAALVAEALNALPALLDELDALRALRARVEAESLARKDGVT